MSRAPFNTTYDVYYGPTSSAGTPGTLYLAAQPCRVVTQDQITQVEFPSSFSTQWLTYSGPQFNMADQVRLTGQVYSIDYGSADVLAIPSGADPEWTVLRAEYIVPLSGVPYNRVLIVPTAEIPVPPPPPPPPPPPGDCGYQAVGGPVMTTVVSPVSPDTKAWSGTGTGGLWYLESYDLYPGYWALYKGGDPTAYDTVWANFTTWDGVGCGGDFERLSGGALPNPQTVCKVECP